MEPEIGDLSVGKEPEPLSPRYRSRVHNLSPTYRSHNVKYVAEPHNCETPTTAQNYPIPKTPVTVEELASPPGGRQQRYFPYKEEVGGSSPSTPTNNACHCSSSDLWRPSHLSLAIIDLPIVVPSSPRKRSAVRAPQRPPRKASLLLTFFVSPVRNTTS